VRQDDCEAARVNPYHASGNPGVPKDDQRDRFVAKLLRYRYRNAPDNIWMV
jgi:hypothetical protein